MPEPRIPRLPMLRLPRLIAGEWRCADCHHLSYGDSDEPRCPNCHGQHLTPTVSGSTRHHPPRLAARV